MKLDVFTYFLFPSHLVPFLLSPFPKRYIQAHHPPRRRKMAGQRQAGRVSVIPVCQDSRFVSRRARQLVSKMGLKMGKARFPFWFFLLLGLP